jgi:hypothetical protein
MKPHDNALSNSQMSRNNERLCGPAEWAQSMEGEELTQPRAHRGLLRALGSLHRALRYALIPELRPFLSAVPPLLSIPVHFALRAQQVTSWTIMASTGPIGSFQTPWNNQFKDHPGPEDALLAHRAPGPRGLGPLTLRCMKAAGWKNYPQSIGWGCGARRKARGGRPLLAN